MDSTCHEVYTVGPGFIGVRTTERARRVFAERYGAAGNIYASEVAITFQYNNKKERSYLRCVLFVRHIASVNAVGEHSAIVHMADGTFVFLAVTFDALQRSLFEAERSRVSQEFQQLALRGQALGSIDAAEAGGAPDGDSKDPDTKKGWRTWFGWGSQQPRPEQPVDEPPPAAVETDVVVEDLPVEEALPAETAEPAPAPEAAEVEAEAETTGDPVDLGESDEVGPTAALESAQAEQEAGQGANTEDLALEDEA